MRNFAWLKEESPFFDLFPNGMVPIHNIAIPSQVELEGCLEREAYMVNIERLTPEEFAGVVARLAAMASANAHLVAEEIRERGLPLRASQVRTVTTDAPFFL